MGLTYDDGTVRLSLEMHWVLALVVLLLVIFVIISAVFGWVSWRKSSENFAAKNRLLRFMNPGGSHGFNSVSDQVSLMHVPEMSRHSAIYDNVGAHGSNETAQKYFNHPKSVAAARGERFVEGPSDGDTPANPWNNWYGDDTSAAEPGSEGMLSTRGYAASHYPDMSHRADPRVSGPMARGNLANAKGSDFINEGALFQSLHA